VTGPNINRPKPGSNAIGSFAIGVSPVGTISPFDYWTTVISQYANSKVLMQLVEGFNDTIDQTQNMDSFYDLIWNIDTAQGYGLDVWGRIINVSRTLNLTTIGDYFGFSEALPGSAGFNQSPFYPGSGFTDNFNLTDGAYRVLLFAKALANISDGSTKAINQLLLNLFPGRGNCYVVDRPSGVMTMAYAFDFTLTPVELAIIGQSGALPKPTGVSATIIQA
jgi:hypothetical protein